MTTWEEIRDEIAGMLADGKPLEDVIAKLDEMNKPKPMTNEDWFCGLSTEEKAGFISAVLDYGFGIDYKPINPMGEDVYSKEDIELWLKKPHKENA